MKVVVFIFLLILLEGRKIFEYQTIKLLLCEKGKRRSNSFVGNNLGHLGGLARHWTEDRRGPE